MIRRRSRSIRGSRRKSRWEGTYSYRSLTSAGVAVPTVAGSSVVDTVWARVPGGVYDSINAQRVDDDCTVYRMIHAANIALLKTTSAGSIEVAVGMGIVAWDDIDDTPPTALDVPLPCQSPGFDWLWWWVTPFQVQNQAVNYNAAAQNLYSVQNMVFTKSMRKLSTGTGLLLVVEIFALIDGMAANFGWDYHGRYALKLP